ncbi:MAG: hypothetical protein QME84_12405 [Actinomycetota bacterium]|nr:hypothetical protein [Actinomycetota bacterium]
MSGSERWHVRRAGTCMYLTAAEKGEKALAKSLSEIRELVKEVLDESK